MPPRKDFKPSKDLQINDKISSTVPISVPSSSSMDILTDDEKIHLPVIDNANQSSVKKSQQRDALSNDAHHQQQQQLKNRLLLRGNDLLAQSTTETLLDMLKSHAGIKECSDETVLHINGILTELYTRVKGARGDWRSSVLGSLYGLVECTSPKILLSVARVVLVLGVTGSNLTGACKLVFKVARNERNDNLFINCDVPELLIDGLGRASPIEDPEACIYGYGAVRFLANAAISSASTTTSAISTKTNQISTEKMTTAQKHKSLAQRLVRHGAIPLMILHLQMINETGATTKLTGPPLHALYQLSGALRVLANISPNELQSGTCLCEPPSNYNTIDNTINTRTLNDTDGSQNRLHRSCPIICEICDDYDIQLDLAGPHLVRAAEICVDEIEVQSNIVRTMSVLSEQDKCCDAISDMSARLGILLGPGPNIISNYRRADEKAIPEKSLGILSRIGYILGNIMARSDSARMQFYNNDVAMEYLLNNLDGYSTNHFTVKKKTTSNGDENHANGGDTVIDVVIKLIRIIANMSVNAEVGYGLAVSQPLGSILLTLLLTINKYRSHLNTDMEELLLATLGAIHNLSFYQNAMDTDDLSTASNTFHAACMITRTGDISAALCVTYQHGPDIAKPEVARVLGNMTRSSIARNAVCSAGALKFLVKNLASDDLEISGTSCGVLVNLLSDWERRAPFRELRGPLLLRDVLQRAAVNQDWLLALITCQALWNYLIDTGNIIGALGEDEADYISADLLEYLDEERLFGGEAPDPTWEQFAIVAADLLERIQSSLSYNNSPYDSSDEEIFESHSSDKTKISREKFKMWLAESA